jgi:hypothetical protein
MPDYYTLTCPTCGGKLQITDEIDRFTCAHCGNEHIVKRMGGTISLAPVVEGLSNIQVGVDKTASELAITRLREEIRILQNNLEQFNKQNSFLAYIFIITGLLSLFASGGGLFGVILGDHGAPLWMMKLCCPSSVILLILGTLIFRQKDIQTVEELQKKQIELSKHETIVKQ